MKNKIKKIIISYISFVPVTLDNPQDTRSTVFIGIIFFSERKVGPITAVNSTVCGLFRVSRTEKRCCCWFYREKCSILRNLLIRSLPGVFDENIYTSLGSVEAGVDYFSFE